MTEAEYREQHPEYDEYESEMCHDCSLCRHKRTDGNMIRCPYDESPRNPDCGFELMKPTLAQAVSEVEDLSIDYGTRTQEEVDYIDACIDALIEFAKKHLEREEEKMITELDEAIEHCKEVAEKLRDDAESRFYDEDSCLACADEHEQLAEWITELQERREADRWIPVSERLPNHNGVYNVTRKLNEGETIYFISDASYFDGQNTWHADTGINHGRPYLTDIIAWKPLPKPYESEGKE